MDRPVTVTSACALSVLAFVFAEIWWFSERFTDLAAIIGPLLLLALHAANAALYGFFIVRALTGYRWAAQILVFVGVLGVLMYFEDMATWMYILPTMFLIAAVLLMLGPSKSYYEACSHERSSPNKRLKTDQPTAGPLA